ncbi:hypothetical protein Ccrd_019999 [Cynara cardunculus var. scolymus]|uniref:Uncharacterized protein n=1 Tax=Cynara cardunculus var. scolymus TaxID=59895 RepID=A0A103Y3A6_CYNCS|nr:hypothetical protein Ccrd_019999 [Cynara cardunculus var. scolymus]
MFTYPNHPPLGGSVNPMNIDGMMGKPSASTMGVKMQEKPMKHSHSMVLETLPPLLDASRMTLLKPANNHQSLGNSPNVSSTLQKIQGNPNGYNNPEEFGVKVQTFVEGGFVRLLAKLHCGENLNDASLLDELDDEIEDQQSPVSISATKRRKIIIDDENESSGGATS